MAEDRAKELRAVIPEELVNQRFNVESLIRIILWVLEQHDEQCFRDSDDENSPLDYDNL